MSQVTAGIRESRNVFIQDRIENGDYKAPQAKRLDELAEKK